MTMPTSRLATSRLATILLVLLLGATCALAQRDDRTLRVFVFAGQSNMEGADSKVADIERFPPFSGLGEPQPKVRFWYCLGRENKQASDGWTALRPARGMVGPELSFARKVTANIRAPIAIIKVAAGGTTLGADWNPEEPQGFELYPLALDHVQRALRALDRQRVRWRLEGFVWHQGENDMFDEGFRAAYGDNLKAFMARWRRDLDAPALRFYVGELCTKTIWGMDLRPRMNDIAIGQRAATDADPLAQYVRNAHIGVEIGGGVGLHYHYGTLGQLEHGECYADAYLRNVDALPGRERKLTRWPYASGKPVDLYVLAGHRNMEGERAFVQQLGDVKGGKALRRDLGQVAFRYDVGGGAAISNGWEPLGVAGPFDTFGPEVSFAHALHEQRAGPFAIAKFTHSGSQIVDWAPDGSVAKARNLYPRFLAFVKESVQDLERRGHEVRLRAIVYHLGENDMSWTPHRRQAAKWLGELAAQLRRDLGMPELRWVVSQQRPTDHRDVNGVDPVAMVRELCAADPHMQHVEAFEPPPQDRQLVFDTAAVVWLGQLLAEAVRR
ncbi:MAG: sialate O-acetylesterase [Planctomycetota bacterium]